MPHLLGIALRPLMPISWEGSSASLHLYFSSVFFSLVDYIYLHALKVLKLDALKVRTFHAYAVF